MSARADLDAPHLRLVGAGHGQRQRQHAVGQVRLDPLGVVIASKGKAPLVIADLIFTVEGRHLLWPLVVDLGADCQLATVKLDVEAVGFRTRHVRDEDEALVGLGNIAAGAEGAACPRRFATTLLGR